MVSYISHNAPSRTQQCLLFHTELKGTENPYTCLSTFDRYTHFTLPGASGRRAELCIKSWSLANFCLIWKTREETIGFQREAEFKPSWVTEGWLSENPGISSHKFITSMLSNTWFDFPFDTRIKEAQLEDLLDCILSSTLVLTLELRHCSSLYCCGPEKKKKEFLWTIRSHVSQRFMASWNASIHLKYKKKHTH